MGIRWRRFNKASQEITETHDRSRITDRDNTGVGVESEHAGSGAGDSRRNTGCRLDNVCGTQQMTLQGKTRTAASDQGELGVIIETEMAEEKDWEWGRGKEIA